MKSRITLTFTNIVIGDFVEINALGALNDIIIEIFVDYRVSANTVSTEEEPLASQDIINASEFMDSFNADYNQGGLGNYNVSRDSNVVTIECKLDFVTFSLITSQNIGVVIENGVFVEPFTIDNITYDKKVGEECTKLIVSVTTSEQAINVTSPLAFVPNTNPFTFDWSRGENIDLIVNNANNSDSQNIQLPSLLLPPHVEVLNSPSGATISLSSLSSGLIKKYSLNGVDYFDSNIFTGILKGFYTAYVKDQFDCVKTKGFEVSEFSTIVEGLKPYAFISNANPLKFSKREKWNGTTVLKNEENTLSCEEEVYLPKKWYHLKQTNDTDRVQILSNFTSVKAFVNDGVIKTELPLVLKSDNIGKKDMRDAKIYQKENGKAGLYFITGKTYDYDTSADLSNDYFLNGQLPEWAKVGGYFYLGGIGYMEMTDKTYEDSKNAWVMEFNFATTVLPVDVIVSALYNFEDYEVYEFDIDYLPYLDKNINVSVEHYNNDFEKADFLSEDINVKKIHERTLEVRYWSEENTDLFYALTGLKNKIRLSYENFYAAVDDDYEVNKGDNSVQSTNISNYKTKVLELTHIPTGIMRHLSEVFSHDMIFINNIEHKIQGKDVSEPLGSTNWYDFKVNLINAGTNIQNLSYYEELFKRVVEKPKLEPFDSDFINVADIGESPILLAHETGAIGA